jgi:hypothetical protein
MSVVVKDTQTKVNWDSEENKKSVKNALDKSLEGTCLATKTAAKVIVTSACNAAGVKGAEIVVGMAVDYSSEKAEKSSKRLKDQFVDYSYSKIIPFILKWLGMNKSENQ